jgi:hypothetical protein
VNELTSDAVVILFLLYLGRDPPLYEISRLFRISRAVQSRALPVRYFMPVAKNPPSMGSMTPLMKEARSESK